MDHCSARTLFMITLLKISYCNTFHGVSKHIAHFVQHIQLVFWQLHVDTINLNCDKIIKIMRQLKTCWPQSVKTELTLYVISDYVADNPSESYCMINLFASLIQFYHVGVFRIVLNFSHKCFYSDIRIFHTFNLNYYRFTII